MAFLRTLSLASASHFDGYMGSPPALLMRNTFLVFRLVLLGLLFNFALLSLIFAAWNINASIAAGIPASSASIFTIFQSCLVFFGITIALADLFRPKARMSRTMVECFWVAILCTFQMGAAIGTVVATPGSACLVDANHNICVSASLLIPISWLSALLFMSYFLALFVATMAHKRIYPDIWKRTVYSIQWFEGAREPLAKEKFASDFYAGSVFDDKDVYAAFYHDLESTGTRKLNFKDEPAPWAATSPVRRGIDPPFARKPGEVSSARSSPLTVSSPSLPSLPDRSADPFAVSPAGSRFIERFRESTVLARAESPAEFTKHYHAHARTSSFPLSVLDLDQPIPLTRLSEWVRVEDAKDAQLRGGALFAQ